MVAKDLRFTSNLRDAIASACRNQSEGFYKFKHKEQRPYFKTARASLGETKDGIRDGLQRRYFSPEVAEENEEALWPRNDRKPAVASIPRSS